jgi:hypothetical protein
MQAGQRSDGSRTAVRRCRTVLPVDVGHEVRPAPSRQVRRASSWLYAGSRR